MRVGGAAILESKITGDTMLTITMFYLVKENHKLGQAYPEG